MKSIMEKAEELEQIPGMMSVQVFNGQPWIDAPYNGPNFVVTHENDTEKAKECADILAKMFYDVRYDFEFLTEAVDSEEAVKRAMNADESNVFISDSGDNTTAGAAGDNAYMLNLLQKMGVKNALLAGLTEAQDKCDITVSIDCDGQDDINAVDKMIDEAVKKQIDKRNTKQLFDSEVYYDENEKSVLKNQEDI